MLIHINRDGEQFGPYTLEDLNVYLAQGALFPTDLAWWDGAPGWVQMNEVPGVVLPRAIATDTPALTPKAGGWKKSRLIISVVVAITAVVVGLVFIIKGDGDPNSSSQSQTENLPGKNEQGTGSQMSGEGNQVFAKTVEPIFRKNRCFECHNSKESKKAKADLDFSIPSTLLAFVSPNQKGNPATTPLVLAITPGAAEPMPPKGPAVSDADVELIKQWIAAGAKF